VMWPRRHSSGSSQRGSAFWRRPMSMRNHTTSSKPSRRGAVGSAAPLARSFPRAGADGRGGRAPEPRRFPAGCAGPAGPRPACCPPRSPRRVRAGFSAGGHGRWRGSPRRWARAPIRR
jgi:hypothetical protein